MKKSYLILLLTITTFFSYAQNYEFGIINISDYEFKIVAIPDFTSTGNTDVSDVGFTLVLPTGDANVTNHLSLLPSRTWSVQEYDAAFLTNLGLGDGTKDVFQFNMPPGQSILSHTAGEQIDLVSFSISNSPVSGNMYFLLNNDSIAVGAGGVLDSFYNSNIDASTTQDYFSTPAPGLDNFMFSTLTVSNVSDLHGINIYPNPVKTLLHIKTNMTSNLEEIRFYSLDGKLVFNEEEINMSLGHFIIDTTRILSNGMYLMTVITKSGEKATYKVLIEH